MKLRKVGIYNINSICDLRALRPQGRLRPLALRPLLALQRLDQAQLAVLQRAAHPLDVQRLRLDEHAQGVVLDREGAVVALERSERRAATARRRQRHMGRGR